MSDQILMQMSQQLGELSGKMSASLDAQAETNKAIFTLVKDHDERIKEVEGAKNKILGAAIFSGISGSGIGAFLTKILGVGNGS